MEVEGERPPGHGGGVGGEDGVGHLEPRQTGLLIMLCWNCEPALTGPAGPPCHH